MASHQTDFSRDRLISKLGERRGAALRVISSLSQDEVLVCNSGCLAEIVRMYAVAPPILRLDSMTADERIGESVDITFDRKTGHTNHAFFIPVERDIEWLEGIERQKEGAYPIAFLDTKRSRIEIRLSISPEDDSGALRRNWERRTSLVKEYADAVSQEIIDFNKDLAEVMAGDLNKRKKALQKAHEELEAVGLPLVYNPRHEEQAIQISNVLRNLGAYMTGQSIRNHESETKAVRSFIVHGHDHQSLFELKDYIQNTLKLGEPAVLRQTPGLGRTLIEKFEDEAGAVELVFVLLTPDDMIAGTNGAKNEKRRARQNVIFEMGFFLGKLGRGSGKVLLLHKGPLEIPSDIRGIEYIDISKGIESAGESIRRELKALGILKGDV